MLPPEPAIVEHRQPDRMDGDLLKMFTESALDSTHIRKLGVRLATAAELEEAGRGNDKVKVARIPYFDLSGAEIEFCRFRYLGNPGNFWQRHLELKAPRYFQAPGTGLHAYLPPFCDWGAVAKDASKRVLITEGEKKAAAATAHGFPCVGLGGVDSFATRKEEALLISELMEFNWEGRDVVIIYDSDASDNPNVLAASVRLGRRLFALGAKPRIASLPKRKDGGKQGLDDFIVAARLNLSTVTSAMTALIDTASAELFEREVALYDMNSKFVYVRDMDRVIDRRDCALLVPDAFTRRAYASLKHREWKIKRTKDGDQRVSEMVSTAEAWMEWPDRKTVNMLDFDPKSGEFTSVGYNLWRGWSVQPEPGDASPWIELLDKLYAESPSVERRWFESWCAYPFQQPGSKLKSACLLWSKMEGTGKSTVLECLRAIYGPLFAPMNDSAVDLQWTDWLVGKLMVGVDDISAKTRDDHAAKWKNLITSPRLTINKRHTNSFEVNSFVNFIMTSNEPNALRLGTTDRRYYVHRVSEWGTLSERTAFFDKVYKWLGNGGASHLLYHLLNVDTQGFDPDAPPPVNAAKREMQDLSRGPLEKWVEDLLDAPDAILRLGSTVLQGDLWSSDDLVKLYNATTNTKITRTLMGMVLSSYNVPRANGGSPVKLGSGLQVRLYAIRNPLEWMPGGNGGNARDHYEATTGKS